MNINQTYTFNNGDQVTLKSQYHHYRTDQIDYLIQQSDGTEYIIGQTELQALIQKSRTDQEKLALYIKYFSGRPDVCAQKWSNGKGYSPALKNWWAFYQARNDKVAQEKLPKNYVPYNTQVVRDQITSSDPYHHFGIYPLLDNDCTKLLVFDLDQHGAPVKPAKTAKAIITTCRKYQIDCLPEISSSGNSYHLWLFFKEPIQAATARRLGKLILIEAMVNSEDVDISCFDRMIPNQNRLPKKGFGNLIALPLKWSEVQKQCSIFTDDQLRPLPISQLFDRLEATKRYTDAEIHQRMQKMSQDMQLMSGQNHELSLATIKQFPAAVYGRINGELQIERQSLTRQEQLSLLGLATFSNPEFVKKQRIRAPVWDIPSVLTAGRLDRSNLYLPRGVLGELEKHCRCHFDERFTSAKPLHVTFSGKLRPEQEQAVESVESHQLGMISAHTGFGKTVVGCALVARRHARTLIVVPTASIAKQWQQSAQQFLTIKDEPFEERTKTGRKVRKKKVELISGTRNRPSYLVDVVNIRKLTRMRETERGRFYQNYSQIIVDECHHISATTFEQVLVQANVRYIVGLTATPERNDGLEKFMHYRCGAIRYQSRAEDNYLIQRYLYVRYTGFGENAKSIQRGNYAQLLNELSENRERNNLIVNDLRQALQEGRHILLLSERIKHLRILRDLLAPYLSNSQLCLITGGKGTNLTIGNEEQPYVILSTNKYVGEGFDLPSLDTLFLTLPFSWKGNTKQYLGRLERGLLHKDELRVYDYVDIANDTFAKMYQKRVRVYKKQGYEFVKSKKWKNYAAVYYTNSEYFQVWQQDFAGAAVIYLRIKRLDQLQVDMLNRLSKEKKEIYLETEMAGQSELEKHLSRQISVNWCRRIGNNICVFDYRVCWYGDLNFGGKSWPNTSGIRLVSRKLATEAMNR
ncbi:TOTE conflict system archaeo-eukaryotic primase domain-containing protein [Limosilactobacillus kribbianus]|uniref:TOTE conflict system archaeo-eukaryotic primase domain-containing protein n=1 Tax=Limosilactobacillus kribbianus TaxID=2982695 RepID=UPI0022649B3C|nr:DEAD/DEAH box helicase family protein [Limosilactobacillus kribbianus]